jgi:RNA polymerase sigma-70 factor (ECF subfamily)
MHQPAEAAPPAAELSVEPAGPAEQTDPSILAEQNERTQRLWRAILRLPLKHREVIVMSHFQHLPYKDIAESLAVRIGTVMSRLHNARKALRDLLGEQDSEAQAGRGDRPGSAGGGQ